MKRALFSGLVIGAACVCVLPAPSLAGGAKKASPPSQTAAGAEHPKSSTYRRAPEVRGFIQRRGGYSYGIADTINTYGDTRTTAGAVNSYRDPWSDRQSRNGPFDHGFFFDSGIAPRGGDSPYRN